MESQESEPLKFDICDALGVYGQNTSAHKEIWTTKL